MHLAPLEPQHVAQCRWAAGTKLSQPPFSLLLCLSARIADPPIVLMTFKGVSSGKGLRSELQTIMHFDFDYNCQTVRGVLKNMEGTVSRLMVLRYPVWICPTTSGAASLWVWYRLQCWPRGCTARDHLSSAFDQGLTALCETCGKVGSGSLPHLLPVSPFSLSPQVLYPESRRAVHPWHE